LDSAEIKALDAADPLAAKRKLFALPDGQLYLNGNSLGPLPTAVQQRMTELIGQEWGIDLVSSWNKHGWIDLPTATGEKVAALIGAAPEQVICCDSVSINLFKLLAAALQLNAGRHVVLSQADNFPTDLYIAQGLDTLLGKARCQLQAVSSENLLAQLNENVAVLYLTQVNFRSGAMHDIAALTAAAHAQGALVIWDLSHSVGVTPLELDKWDVDFAVGCGYKFLNGGPGAPAFIYANKAHHDKFQQPLQGWMGHAEPFAFAEEYEPAGGMAQFLTGTPNILSLVALHAALDVFDDIDMAQVRTKSVQLSELFMSLIAEHEVLQSLQLESPSNAQSRGSQLAYSHPHAYGICQALHARRIASDFRSPSYLRFGFSPLILSFTDIGKAVATLAEIMREGKHLDPAYQHRQKVT